MKKHPVDNLFAKKLSNWEPEAAPELWKRIEARQHKAPRRIGGWYWVAAGVSLTLLAGYLVWQSESAMPGNASQKIARQDTQHLPAKSKADAILPMDTSERLAEAGTGPLAKSKQENPLPNQKENNAPANRRSPVPEETEPVLSTIEVAAIPTETTTPQPLLVEKDPVTLPNVPDAPIAAPHTEETRVVIAHVEPAETEQDEQKSSKFLRILRQLKNAKEGETVDWDEVGFNPKKLMARADERLKNEEEKISKRYQNLKEKTKL